MRFTEGLIKKKHLNNLGLVRNKLRDHTFMIIVESIVFNFFFEKYIYCIVVRMFGDGEGV